MSWKLFLSMAAAIVALLAPSTASAQLTTKQIKLAQAKLAELGFEVGPADGIVGPLTARGMCGFKLLANLRPNLKTMGLRAYRKLMRTKRLPEARNPERRYLSVSTRCQVMYVVKKHRYSRIVPVSTGRAGWPSNKGRWTVFRRVNGWEESNQFSGGMMYRSLYYSGGEAIHGVQHASMVLAYRASHGCIRTFVSEQDRLWRERFKRIGTVVYVS